MRLLWKLQEGARILTPPPPAWPTRTPSTLDTKIVDSSTSSAQFSFLSSPSTWNSTHRCSINTCEGNAQELPGTLEEAALTPTSGLSVLGRVPSSTSFSKWNSATEASSGVFRPGEGGQRSREQIPEPHCLVQTLDPLPT